MARGPAITWPTPGDQGHLRDHRELVKQIQELQDASARQDETIAAMFAMLHDCVSLLQELATPPAVNASANIKKTQKAFGVAVKPAVDDMAKVVYDLTKSLKDAGII